MKRWILIVLIAVALAAVVVIVGFTQIKLDALEEPGHLETVITTQAKHVLIARSSREGVPPAPTNLQASIEEGDKLFGTECAACHGLAHAGDWSRTLSTFEISPYYSGGVWEALAPDGSPATRESAGGTFASLAHGWASGPTSALSKYVLGVRPVQPGYKTWLIEPQPGDLSWAEGRVPTPYGPIAVRWQKSPRGLRLEINVPNGTSGSVGLPTSSNADSVIDNDRPVKKGEKMKAQASWKTALALVRAMRTSRTLDPVRM